MEVSSDELDGVDCKKVLRLLNKIYFKTRGASNRSFKRLLSLVNDTKYDIKYLNGFLNNVTPEFWEGDMSIISYLNTSLGNRYNLLIERLPKVASYQRLVVFALKNKKFAFLNLLENNLEKLQSANATSLLTNESMYQRYVNINEINQEDLNTMLEISPTNNIRVFEENGDFKRLTPKEMIEISTVSQLLQKLYGLIKGKVDYRLILLKQLKKVELPDCYRNEEARKVVAEKLSQRNLAQWKKEFNFELLNETMLEILALNDNFANLIKEATSEVELEFVIRNKETINTEKTLKENLDDFLENDLDCKEMFAIMNLTERFKAENKENIKAFCLKGNASIVVTYYRNQSSNTQRENILRCAKAEMAGEMERFKFHDLDKELEYNLSDSTFDAWKKNYSSTKGSIVAYETYSFNDTMLIGVKPSHTCMNYKDGMYNRCLLANFDSNKKILFAKLNGKIVARAIIRLTKSLKANENKFGKVEFLDVENEIETEKVEFGKQERLTIFLERFYSSHIDAETERTIKNMFVDMMVEKCNDCDARFLASSSYGACTNMEETNMKVFISHTKNGVQYMDSFNGSNGSSSEATYSACDCYRKKTK